MNAESQFIRKRFIFLEMHLITYLKGQRTVTEEKRRNSIV